MRSLAELQEIVNSGTVAKSIFELRPDYTALLIAVDNIKPSSPSDTSSDQLVRSAEAAAKARISSTVITEIPEIKAWRDTYKSFGAKPKKYQSSIEALTRRAVAAGLPRVNKLTDIYNAVSVLHSICIGREDLDTYVGFPRLVRATGNETFETRSGHENPEKGEVVWCDEQGVTCRNWNWRQCVRTQLRNETTSALFILDALKPVNRQRLELAGEELVEMLREGSKGLVVAKRVFDAKDSVDK